MFVGGFYCLYFYPKLRKQISIQINNADAVFVVLAHKFMDLKIWVPLGRLSFSFYLVQLVPMAYDLSQTYERIPIQGYPLVSTLSAG